MTSDNKNTDDFEDGLRHILSPEPVLPSGKGNAPRIDTTASSRRSAESATHNLQAAADRLEAEQRALKIFKIIRAVAAVALVVLLASFVYRITNPEIRNKRRGSLQQTHTEFTLCAVSQNPFVN